MMAQLTPTPEQQAVIDAPLSDTLISAAAGSGKTTVMTDRIVQRLAAHEVDVNSLLVMTFTDKAALQMREKIGEKLRAALTAAENEAARVHLRRQLMQLPGALVSTIHAFCLSVIRNFYYEARDEKGEPLVLPDFRIDDGTETKILLQDALDDLLRECYEAIDLSAAGAETLPLPPELKAALPQYLREDDFTAVFYRLTDGYGGARNDEALMDLILSVYLNLRSMPDYRQVIADKVSTYKQASTDFAASRAAEILLEQLGYRLDRAMTVIPEMEDLLPQVIFAKDKRSQANSLAEMRGCLSTLRTLHTGIRSGSFDYDTAWQASRPLAGIKIPRRNKNTDSAEKTAFLDLFCEFIAEAVYTAAGSCKSERTIKAFQHKPLIVCERPAAEITADLQEMLPVVELFFALILALDQRYATTKQQYGIIDFSDFEHLALAILRAPEARSYYRSRIAEIYIDEYQDTSQIQEAIIAEIRNDNCLMVGDVKQSIYRFRHARPQIFLERLLSCRDGESGKLFELNRNFRSQTPIIDAVNQWFGQLMSPAVGEIDYNTGHSLIAGAKECEDSTLPAVKLLALNLQSVPEAEAETIDGSTAEAAADSIDDNNAEASAEQADGETAAELNKYEQEARVAALEIKKLLAAGVACSDIAILVRTRGIMDKCASILTDYGIPLEEPETKPFLDTPVLRLLEALVHVLDNRRQDIHLAAVMRSPLYSGGFSDNELAQMRLESSQTDCEHVFFHEVVDWYASEGADEVLQARTAGFCSFIDDLRRREPVLSIVELLLLVLEKTGFRDHLARLTGEPTALAELNMFLNFANNFEQRGRRGIYAFARHIERLHQLKQKQPDTDGSPEKSKAVRLMTMHGSKGLEFPVVFIIGVRSQLNLSEERQAVLLSEEVGIGIDYVDPERRIRYPTPLKQAMFEELKARSRSEELRLLYVALTRAKQNLYVLGSFAIGAAGDKNAVRLIEAARKVSTPLLPAHLVLAAKSYQDWLLLAIARNPEIDLTPFYGNPENEEWVAPSEPAAPVLKPISGLSVEFISVDSLPGPESFGEEINVEAATTPAEADKATFEAALAPGEEHPPETGVTAYETASSPDCTTEAKSFNSGLLLYDPLPQEVEEPLVSAEQQAANLQRIETEIFSRYLWAGTVQLPQKISVSELKRRADRLNDAEPGEDSSFVVQGINHEIREWTAPEAATAKISAAEIGTLVHQAMRFLDLGSLVRNPTETMLLQQLEVLAAHGIISADMREYILPYSNSMLKFFASPLAQRMLLAEQAGTLFREMPFSIAVPAESINTTGNRVKEDDRVLVQGMIDVWFRENNRAVLLDFKTDRLEGSAGQRAANLLAKYRVQLEYYARAITLSTGLQVAERLIYSLRDGQLIAHTSS